MLKEVEKLLGFIENGYMHAADEYTEKVRQALADERARRIRELATDWVRNGVYRDLQASTEAEAVRLLIAQSARLIDAIDAAEIPPHNDGNQP